ncbi:hypothetical protein HDU96_009467, partial [Phlyctochytrium bullatum]
MKTEIIYKNVTAAYLGATSLISGFTNTDFKCNGKSVDVNGWLACEHKLYSTIIVDDLAEPGNGTTSGLNGTVSNNWDDDKYPYPGQYRSQHSCPDFLGFGCPQDGRRGEAKWCTTLTSAFTFMAWDKALTPVFGKGIHITTTKGTSVQRKRRAMTVLVRRRASREHRSRWR